MENIIVIAILLLVVGSACFYIWKEKKSGKRCIGCSSSTSGSCCGHCGETKEKSDNESH